VWTGLDFEPLEVVDLIVLILTLRDFWRDLYCISSILQFTRR
jgi:hypothetical protein